MSVLARLLELEPPPLAPEMRDAAFEAALAQERTRVLRKRLLWYCGVAAVALGMSALFNALSLIFNWDGSAAERGGTRLDLASDFVLIAIFVGTGVVIRAQKPDHEGLVTILRRLWILAGGVALFTQPLANYLNINPDTPGAVSDSTAMAIGLAALTAVFVLHFVGSLIIPLTWREALVPILLLWITFTVVALILYPGHWAIRALLVIIFPLVGVPGVFWSFRSYTRLGERFHTRVLGERYGELKSELASARRIHESLFPAPVSRGPIEMRYWYDPMREIGGDFLYVHPPAGTIDPAVPGPMTVVLIDVSGHGIPAALAVNRLHGEIQRFFAEKPDATPGELITDLNAYAHAALAGQAMFATAIAVRIEPGPDAAAPSTLTWANAGHPPGMVRPAAGGLEQLEGTCTMLGVLPADAFDAEQRTKPILPGDRVILYTDGAMDARDEQGQHLGMAELHRSLLPYRSSTEEPLDNAKRRITLHRGKAPLADDCLVVQVAIHPG
jgi:sigma-B regulation protein RsbU (phosphoserine phosphatase)